MSNRKSRRGIAVGVGVAAGAFLAVGFGSLTTGPLAHADDDGDGITIASPPGPDSDFIYNTMNIFGITDTAADDPDEHFGAMVLQIPSLGITDVLTSGIDPSDHLALVTPGLGLPADVTAGTVDVTVNTFSDSMNPGLDGSFTIPFTDPINEIWQALIPLGF